MDENENFKNFSFTWMGGLERGFSTASIGYSEEFIRMWEFYLCYCEGGFEERTLSDVQILLVQPENRTSAKLPYLGLVD